MIIIQNPETRRAETIVVTFATQRLAAKVRQALRRQCILSQRSCRELRILIPYGTTASHMHALAVELASA